MAEEKHKEKHKGFTGFGKIGNLFKKKEDDPVFLGHKENFKKQRAIATQYNILFMKYEESLKDTIESQEKLHNFIQQAYETDWVASYELKDYFRASSVEWNNYQNLLCRLAEEQKTYLAKFDELKKKITYRRKKQDEFEHARKDLESKQQSKKPDQSKIAIAENDFKARKTEYERIHTEVIAELPEFYESRIGFYQKNSGDLARGDRDLYGELLDYLKRACGQFETANGVDDQKHRQATRLPSDAATNPFSDTSNSTPTGLYPSLPRSETIKESPTPRHRMTLPPSSSSSTASENKKSAAPIPQHSPAPVTVTPNIPAKPPRITKMSADVSDEVAVEDSPGNPFLTDESESEAVEKCEQEVHTGEKARSSSNSTEEKRESTIEAIAPQRSPRPDSGSRHSNDSSPGAGAPEKDAENCEPIRQVRATHNYVAIEDDELAFEKGDIIDVLPWLSEDDAEEGWLRGRREGDTKCGVFPENHTKSV